MLPRIRPIGGMMMSSTIEETMAVKAAPITIPTAMSSILPFIANSLNSLNIRSSSQQKGQRQSDDSATFMQFIAGNNPALRKNASRARETF